MRFAKLRMLGTVASMLAMTVMAGPASAACTRLGFTVNDYGKEGPTRDAKNLLDKYIARWATEKGIKGYKTGPKSVKCELFLDVGFFDEHTCRAEASVCWDGPAVPGMPGVKPETATAPEVSTPKSEKPAKASESDAKPAGATPAKKADANGSANNPVVETGSTAKSAVQPPDEVKPEPVDLGDPDPASANYGGKNPASGR